MDAANTQQAPSLSAASTVVPPYDPTPQVSNLGMDSYVETIKISPDGEVLARRDKLRQNSLLNEWPLNQNHHLISTAGPGSEDPDWRRPFVTVFPPGSKHKFVLHPINAAGENVTVESLARRAVLVPVRTSVDGIPTTIFVPGRQTELRLNFSRAETDPGTRPDSQPAASEDLSKHEDTSDGIKLEGVSAGARVEMEEEE